jgi:hypothetical protein
VNSAVRELLAEVVDYAGLFPPAGCDMRSAVSNFAAYRTSENSWMLARFVVPVARLSEFAAEATRVIASAETWRLSALCGPETASDLRIIADFNQRHGNRFLIDTIELKAAGPEETAAVIPLIPRSITPYFELSITGDPTISIQTAVRLGGRVKVRTGGITADAFPSSAALARFIKICADERAAFKATAGLHHALRSVQRLTYAADSASSLMHGFLNVFLAGCFARNGMSVDRLQGLLDEREPAPFRFADGITWRNNVLNATQLREARGWTAISFGSCSFEEPVQELKKMGLL